MRIVLEAKGTSGTASARFHDNDLRGRGDVQRSLAQSNAAKGRALHIRLSFQCTALSTTSGHKYDLPVGRAAVLASLFGQGRAERSFRSPGRRKPTKNAAVR